VHLGDVSRVNAPRISTANPEFDRVLGGGLVPGSLVLLGGEPGIGKSTLLLQIAQNLGASGRVLYVSGEESAQQIKLRAERLGEADGDVYVLTEANLEKILSSVSEIRPSFLIVDSVQTTYSDLLDSAPGSISQVRHVATQFLALAKGDQVPVFLIGHVTKDGKIVRAVKNRYGAANEVGIFEMTPGGLIPVRNPSHLFLPDRQLHSPGSSIVCALEGTRPMLVEVQALVTGSQFGTARRTSTGIDYNRISMLVAMLEKRLEIPLMGCDIYVNAAGGLAVSEPAADLGIFCAILSSFRNRALAGDTVLLGELGLSGEVRPISQASLRIREAATMGFHKCLLPEGNLPLVDAGKGIETIPVRSVVQLSDLIF